MSPAVVGLKGVLIGIEGITAGGEIEGAGLGACV